MFTFAFVFLIVVYPFPLTTIGDFLVNRQCPANCLVYFPFLIKEGNGGGDETEIVSYAKPGSSTTGNYSSSTGNRHKLLAAQLVMNINR